MIMNFRVILLCFWFLISAFAIDHGIYITVFDIHHDDSTGRGEIVIKTFSDDLINALKSINMDVSQDADICGQKEALNEYVEIHFEMNINDVKVDWKISDCQIENDTHWITLTYTSKERLRQLQLSTDWLTELYSNQYNIIKVRSGNQKQHARLSIEKTTASLSFASE